MALMQEMMQKNDATKDLMVEKMDGVASTLNTAKSHVAGVRKDVGAVRKDVDAVVAEQKAEADERSGSSVHDIDAGGLFNFGGGGGLRGEMGGTPQLVRTSLGS